MSRRASQGFAAPGGAQHHTFTCTQYNAGMNITFALDDELIAAAKAVAAKHGTSVTALVRTALEQQVAVDNDASWMGASGVLQELIDYSLGFKPRSVVMGTLGLDDYGALLRLLNAASLPHPIVPIAKRKAMVAEMKSAIQWAP